MSNRDHELQAWLMSTIGHGDFDLEPASADASFRRYFRASYRGQTTIIMDAPPAHEDCRPFLAVTDLLRDAGLNVPRVIAQDVQLGFLLLSDLGKRQYLQELTEERASALYGDALDALIRMQVRVDPTQVPCYSDHLLRAELALFATWFLTRHLGICAQHPIHNLLEPCFDALCSACQEQPQVFVHRDYHSRNLMVQAQRNPGIIDYQDAVAGPVTYDLVSLLRDVYIRWPEHRLRGWLEQYHQMARERGVLVDCTPATLRRWFDLTGVQRHLKIAGVFARLYYRDGKPGYLSDLNLVLGYLLEVGVQYDASRALVDALQDLDVQRRLRERNAELLVNVDA